MMGQFQFRSLIRLAAVAFTLSAAGTSVVAVAQSRPALPGDGQAPAKGAQDERSGGLSAELMYRLLVGDVALQRGDTALAARAYFEAARDARDVRLARRATEIALAARQRALAVEGARLWAELDPAAERPK